MMHGDSGIDQIAAQCPQPRQGAILVRAGEPAEADHVGRQDRRKFACLGHAVPTAALDNAIRQPPFFEA